MCGYNFQDLDHTDNLGPLELSFPSNAPGNDKKKKIQLPILSNVGKVFQDVYSVASRLHRGMCFQHESVELRCRIAAHGSHN